MIDVVNFIYYIALSLIAGIMLYVTVSSVIQNRSSSIELVQTKFENQALKARLLEEINKKDDAQIEHTEGFVKFISQSREKAFEYIEDVQKTIQDLKTFKDTVGETPVYLSSEELQDLDSIIKKLLLELPEES